MTEDHQTEELSPRASGNRLLQDRDSGATHSSSAAQTDLVPAVPGLSNKTLTDCTGSVRAEFLVCARQVLGMCGQI